MFFDRGRGYRSRSGGNGRDRLFRSSKGADAINVISCKLPVVCRRFWQHWTKKQRMRSFEPAASACMSCMSCMCCAATYETFIFNFIGEWSGKSCKSCKSCKHPPTKLASLLLLVGIEPQLVISHRPCPVLIFHLLKMVAADASIGVAIQPASESLPTDLAITATINAATD